MRLIRSLLITSMLFLATVASAGTKSKNPQFAYVAGAHSVSAYRIDAATGSLAPVPGSPFVDDSNTTIEVVDIKYSTNAAGTFAYVMEEDTATRFTFGDFSVYRINTTTGALTPVSYIEDGDGLSPSSLIINPAGTFAYVINQGIRSENGSITAYRINAATGSLTPVTGSPFAAREYPYSLTFNTAGTFAYVVTLGHPGRHNGSITAYRVNTATGVLTLVPSGSLATGVDSEFLGVTFNSAGTVAYVMTPGEATHQGRVSAYRVNATTGALMHVPGSSLETGIDPSYITINPAGTFAYVVNKYGNGSVSVYGIDAATGGLAPVHGSPFMAGHSPQAITINAAGTFAYIKNISNGNSSVSVYSINATAGGLSPVQGSSFATGGDRSGDLVINSSGTFAYVDDSDGDVIFGYCINAVTGLLTNIDDSPFNAGADPGSFMIVQP